MRNDIHHNTTTLLRIVEQIMPSDHSPFAVSAFTLLESIREEFGRIFSSELLERIDQIVLLHDAHAKHKHGLHTRKDHGLHS